MDSNAVSLDLCGLTPAPVNPFTKDGKAFVKSVNNRIPIVVGITGEATDVAALEAKRAREAGAAAGLLHPSHGWLRFGYQPGAPQDRYKAVREDTEIPVIHKERINPQVLSCHDEYLYGKIAPERIIELIKAGKAKDYPKAKEIHNRLPPVTTAVHHRGSHMEGTVALKHALVARDSNRMWNTVGVNGLWSMKQSDGV
ncbi:hypothetical protein CTRI78_v010964 [Colletotrichum trifolii]|uniref:Uncharacterized protein n=1 Tax=Colletotrichum trifolii TaxID=5466 RepID=A0A4R8QLH0_COLTR|nr:hypothetical protein CTRI78_v010964 [Colletotrichum trifolii]